MGILNVDLIIFVSLVFVYNKLKQSNPNMLFLGEGVSVFLPPEEKDYKDLVQSQVKNSKKGGKKPLMPMKIMKAKSDFFSKYPLAVELDIAIMLLVCMSLQFIFSEVIRRVISVFMPDFAEKDMSITFSLGLSVLLLLMAYYCKSVKMAGWRSSETKTAFLIAIVSSLLILTLFFGFKEIVNFDFEQIVKLQRNHLKFVFLSSEQMDFSIEVFQIGCVFLNAIATFSVVPTIIRFASCYSSNLRKTIESKARQIDAEERAAQSKKDDSNPFLITQTEQEENLENLVEKQTNTDVPRHKSNMLFFNLSLVIHLVSIVLWIQPVVSIATSQFGQANVDKFLQPLRLTLVIVQSILSLLTVKYQVQMFMMKSFDYLKSLANDSNEATYKVVKYKTSAYVQSCMHAAFQILVFAVIPLLISLLIIYRCYLSPSRALPEPAVISDAATTETVERDIEFFKDVFNNIKLYSIFNSKFIEITLSFWLFNYQVITYILKIVFIIITRQSNGV